jgi:putative ABC transport system substrate-binding protein
VADLDRDSSDLRASVDNHQDGRTSHAVIRNPTNPGSTPQLRWITRAATGLHLQLQVIDVKEPAELESAFSAVARQKLSALTVLADPMLLSQRIRIAELASRHSLATTFNWRQYAEAGGLMSYGPDLVELWRRRAATFVDRILKGGKAAEMPVEQPTKFEFVVNSERPRRWA